MWGVTEQAGISRRLMWGVTEQAGISRGKTRADVAMEEQTGDTVAGPKRREARSDSAGREVAAVELFSVSRILLFLMTLMTLLLAGVALPEESLAQKRWDEITYPELNSFEMPDMEIFELSNGIRFYLVEDHELPIIDVRVLVRTGGFLVPDSKAGLEQITGTVMRTGGSESMPGQELNELLENRAAVMETSIGFTSGNARMNVLKEDFDELLPVFVDLLMNPLFPQDRIELAKTQQRSVISRRNDSQSQVANREFVQLIYGEESIFGRLVEYETLDNITRQDMEDLHQRSFTGENLMIGVVGDFDTGQMKRQLEEAFRSVPAGEENEITFPDVNYEFDSSISFVDKRDVNQSYVLMGHIGGLRDNPDYAAIQVMNRALSDGFSGRLFQVVRSEMGLAYSVFGSYGSNFFYPGTFRAGVMTQSASTADAIRAVHNEIERLQQEPLRQEELDRIIERFLNTLVFEYDSRASVLEQRMTYDYAGMPPDTFDRLVEEIQAVTIEDVQEAARQYLRPSSVRILVVGNGAEIGDQLEAFGDVQEVDITIPEPE